MALWRARVSEPASLRARLLSAVAAVLQPLQPVRDLDGDNLVLGGDDVENVDAVNDVACTALLSQWAAGGLSGDSPSSRSSAQT